MNIKIQDSSVNKFLVVIAAVFAAAGLVLILNLVIGGFFLFEHFMDLNQVPCDNLPSLEEAQRVLSEHEDTQRQLQSRLGVWVNADIEDDCAMYHGVERGIISIYYSNLYQKQEIRSILGDTFFGTPYQLFNT